jgi:hypothetical protein
LTSGGAFLPAAGKAVTKDIENRAAPLHPVRRKHQHIRLIRYFELAAGAVFKRNIFEANFIDTRERRAFAKAAAEGLDVGLFPLRLALDAPVERISYPAAQPERIGGILDEISEPDSLDASGHGGGYPLDGHATLPL